MTKPYPCTFKQFLLLGQLGFLEIGAPLDEVFKRLGKPTSTTENSRIYNSLEILIHPSWTTIQWFRLNNSEQNGIQLPKSLIGYGYFPNKNTTLGEIETYLKAEAIEYHVYQYSGGYMKGIHISSNITMNFDGYEDSARFTCVASLS